jgi:hypothetical protein
VQRGRTVLQRAQLQCLRDPYDDHDEHRGAEEKEQTDARGAPDLSA